MQYPSCLLNQGYWHKSIISVYETTKMIFSNILLYFIFTCSKWKHNRLGHPVVDVVVDPYLSNYLRSHQRTGVIFLYECILGMRNYVGEGAILA